MNAHAETRAPRVLLIAGSPRRRGNSDRLLDALEAGVVEAGGEVVRLVASEAGVAPCRGCNACSRDGRCVIRDGMDDINAALDAADAVAVATPVFFTTVPAVLKIVYDRFQPYWARRYVLGEPRPASKRPGAILVVGGGGDPFGVECAVTATRSVFNVLSIEASAVIECVGPDKPGDIDTYEHDLAAAREAGRRLVLEAAE